MTGLLVLLVATFLFVGIASVQAWRDGPTFDEGFTLASGVSALTRHDLRVVPQHPPLGKVFAALPVLLFHPQVPKGAIWDRASRHGGDYRFVQRFMRAEISSGHLRRDLFVARLLPIIEAAAIGWVIALLAGLLFGSTAGVFAALLWLANPFVIGIGHLDGIDIPATLAVVLAVLVTLMARRDLRMRFLVLAGVCAGCTILTRLTGVLMVPVLALAIVTAAWPAGWRAALARGIAVVAIAWATVMGAYAILSPVDILSHARGLSGVLATLGNVIVPPAWRNGTEFLWHAGSKPGPAFVLGFAHTGRWLLYWPASIVVKLPATTVLVLLMGPLALFRLSQRVRREAAMVVVIPAVVHTLFTVQQERPIGLRYLLPALALWLVAAAPIVTVTRHVMRRAVIALAVTGAVAASVITPSLAWTDPLLGPGYRVAADSNLDWGQSYYALQAWTARHRSWIDYFGTNAARFPSAQNLRSAPLSMTGWVAVSASDLTTYDRGRLGWLRAYCPVGVLDRSVVLYYFASPPDRSLHGPNEPPPPCRGRVSTPVATTH